MIRQHIQRWGRVFTTMMCIGGAALVGAATAAEPATLPPVRCMIDVDGGKPLNNQVRGNTPRRGVESRGRTLRVGFDASRRGPAADFDADTYDWRRSTSGLQSGMPGINTLGFLRESGQLRAQNVFIVNIRGVGEKNDAGEWVCRDPNGGVAELATMAAEWVRYVNQIVPKTRAQQNLTDAEQALLKRLKWQGPADAGPLDPPLGPVLWWEIGYLPELDNVPGVIRDHALTPTEYARRYGLITRAMKAVDASIRVGPQVRDLASAHFDALLADPNLPIDFVSHHVDLPELREACASGSAVKTATALRRIRQHHTDWVKRLRSRLEAAKRDPNAPLLVARWNPMGLSDDDDKPHQTLAHGLATMETLLAFQELGVAAAHYWETPADDPPALAMFEKLQEHAGDELLAIKTDDPTLRIWATRDNNQGVIALWALNLSHEQERTVEFGFSAAPPVMIMRSQRLGGGGRAALLRPIADAQTAWSPVSLGAVNPVAPKIPAPPASLTLTTLHLRTEDPHIVSERWWKFAQQLRQRGDQTQALKYLRKIIDEHPQTPAADRARRIFESLERLADPPPEPEDSQPPWADS